MSRLWLGSILVTLSITLFCCSEDSDKTVNPSRPYILGDLVHFDTSVPILISVYDPSGYPWRERHVYREKHPGEPFFDIDGDGVYRSGVDIFHHSVGGSHLDTLYFNCDSVVDSFCLGVQFRGDTCTGCDLTRVFLFQNQDINYNGVYDGPDDYWTPGIPYDDLNGNGEFDRGEFVRYQSGLPYADINENGVYDSALSFRYAIEQFTVETFGPWDHCFTIGLGPRAYATHSYVSDLGVVYELQNYSHSSISGNRVRFQLDSTGFWYTGMDNYPLLILEGPEIYPHQERAIPISESVTEVRSITYQERLTIHGREHSGLVCVDIPTVYANDNPEQPLDIEARFYFAPNTLHLMAMRLYLPYEDSVWIYLDRRLDTLPLPMIR